MELKCNKFVTILLKERGKFIYYKNSEIINGENFYYFINMYVCACAFIGYI